MNQYFHRSESGYGFGHDGIMMVFDDRGYVSYDTVIPELLCRLHLPITSFTCQAGICTELHLFQDTLH